MELQEQLKRLDETKVEIRTTREKSKQIQSSLATLEAELKAEELYGVAKYF